MWAIAVVCCGKSGAKIQFGSFCATKTTAEGKLKELILMVINHERIVFQDMCIINDSSTKKITGKVRGCLAGLTT
ncbi:hypothetical protein CK516_24515 [Nostoc sp. 'Peltigera malacea cyanobiont' DB3992]|nr:hypothetical protein CK516_24515 [Nostoc sp. 'Peltigera malacea cyanobiont' DB3992]